MKKLISFFSLIFFNPVVFANVQVPYPQEYMEFFGCGREDSLEALQARNVLAEYRRTLNQFPKPEGMKKSGNSSEQNVALDKHRKEAERISQTFKQKEEEYCAAQNPISSYGDIIRLPISDFASIISGDYFYGNQFAFNSIKEILDFEFGDRFGEELPIYLTKVTGIRWEDAPKCSRINYEELREGLTIKYGRRNMVKVNDEIEQVKSHCTSIMKVKTGDLIEAYAKRLSK